jgi:hypothetical protein
MIQPKLGVNGHCIYLQAFCWISLQFFNVTAFVLLVPEIYASLVKKWPESLPGYIFQESQ